VVEVIFHSKMTKLKLWQNPVFAVKLIMILILACRIVDYGLWTFQSETISFIYMSYSLFFIFFPYSLEVLCIFLLTVVWYSFVLTLSLSPNQKKYYEFSKKVFLIASCVYSIGGIILIIFMSISLDVFLTGTVIWIAVPSIFVIICCFDSNNKTTEDIKANRRVRCHNSYIQEYLSWSNMLNDNIYVTFYRWYAL